MTMARIEAAFSRARAEKRKALVVYLTVADPDLETSLRLVLAAGRAGADIIELGVPWSDPSADGPAIQAAMLRALKAGGGLSSTLALTQRIRAEAPELPLVLFGYGNPIAIAGPDVFAARARAAGADAALCVDWPPDEDQDLGRALRAEHLDFIPLLAPTSTDRRIAAALESASGFVYYVSLTGITGTKLTDFAGARAHVEHIRATAGGRLPIVVGFGISTPADVKAVAAFADGVVVGTAAVKVIERAVATGEDPVAALSAFVGSLRAALG